MVYGKPEYRSLLDSQFIDEEMGEKLKSLLNPNAPPEKKGRHSSLQKKKSKMKVLTKSKSVLS